MNELAKKVSPAEEHHAKPGRIVIAGFGNILMGDDGIGVRVIEALAARELPEKVVLVDGGTAPMDVLDLLGPSDTLIVIDALNGGKPAGTIYKLTLEEVSGNQGSFSLHEMGVLEALGFAALSGREPASTLIYGIEPGRVAEGLQLSEIVKESIPNIVKVILDESRRLADCAGG